MDTKTNSHEVARMFKKDFIKDLQQILNMYGARLEINENSVFFILEDGQKINFQKEISS